MLIGAKDEKRFQALDEQLSALPLLSTTDDTWRQTAQMGRKLARSGQTVPLIDLLISSIAIESGMTLWTVDSDFKRVEAISELRVNWFGRGGPGSDRKDAGKIATRGSPHQRVRD